MFSHKTSCVYTACNNVKKSSLIFEFGDKSAFKITCSKKLMDNLRTTNLHSINSLNWCWKHDEKQLVLTTMLEFFNYFLSKVSFSILHSINSLNWCSWQNKKTAGLINHVGVFWLFLIITVSCHNLRTCSLARDWSQTINLCENNDKFTSMKTKSTYLQSFEQIEPVAPVTIRKHLAKVTYLI